MINILTIIGARPQIIKAAAISRAIKNKFSDKITEIVVHTGQHYDENMSEVFFSELGIPKPAYNLNVGSGTHGKQTAAMISGIEEILIKENPDCIVLYGDTNSTLAGALAGSKIHVPVVHIEAGLRSFNKSMPEEINRIICDHVSTLLFSPTSAGFNNLLNEGFKDHSNKPYTIDNPKIYHCGDVMYDNSFYFAQVAESKTEILKNLGLESNKFILGTIHRDNNTDNKERLSSIFSTFDKISRERDLKIILPLHPRTSKLLKQNLDHDVYEIVMANENIKIIPSVSFLEMIVLEKNSFLIMTDSGGVQKEAFFFKKPCLILRAETEWTELVDQGAALICDADETKIMSGFEHFYNNPQVNFSEIYGDGKASEFICEQILETFK